MTNSRRLFTRSKVVVAALLIFSLSVVQVFAGILVVGSDGITATGADGVQFTGLTGITATGADGILTFGPNGITATGADGITATGADGITATGADGFTYTGANGITATGADSLLINYADGITATGADGITATGADGTPYHLDSIDIRSPNGITATGADGITATGADGITATGADSRQIANADGITATGVDGVTISGANGITATGADGNPVSIPAGPLTLLGADFLVVVGAHEISLSGAESITETGVEAITALLNAGASQVGLQSIDSELALTLNEITDDRSIDAVIVYHKLPTESDLDQLRNIGFLGGTRFRVLPMVAVSGTRAQIIAVSKLPTVRSIYGNRTLDFTSEPEVRAATGVDRARQDIEINAVNSGLPVSGRNVAVAVLDSGIDATQPDLAGRVIRNVKLASTLTLGVGFSYPIEDLTLPNTDLLSGHGTFVAGLIGGNGNASGGKFRGVAPQTNLVGLSAGELSLLFVLEGFDYLLANHQDLNVRAVNCSFSANTIFDVNDPVNVATKMLTDGGVNVVFSAGNLGPGQHTLNPYAVAPWVISVGSTDTKGKLSTFSSRGDFASALYRPTLVAPGEQVVSIRGAGITNVVGLQGILNGDLQRLSLLELPFYTTSTGTSFSAPQVTGTIALMLEANPDLTPARVQDILKRTSTPLASYYAHEVGAGMLNAHAAVLEAATSRRIGTWRATLDWGQVSFVKDPLSSFTGTVVAGTTFEKTFQVPNDALFASVQIGWGPLLSLNDLSLSIYDSAGNLRAQSNSVNLPGLTGKTERVILSSPAAGTWRIKVRNTLPLGTPQPFSGIVQIDRVSYRPLLDTPSMSSTLRNEVNQTLRSFTMFPIGQKFRPTLVSTRMDLASALVLGASVPQYLPASPSYIDLSDPRARAFVESAQASPSGSLFTDVVKGGTFRPNDGVTRLVAAIAMVRAAGLRQLAENTTVTPSTFLDVWNIPVEYRGYAAVAVQKRFIQSGSLFRPQDPFTRGELAHAMALIQNSVVN